MHKKQIKLSDLAEELGISTATVSRALKNYPDISAETKQKVIALANKWNYRPNSLAASLRNKETHIIGVIIPEVVNHFFAKVIKGIMEVAYDAGYRVMLCQSNEDYDKEVDDAHALLSSRVDGLLASLANHTRTFEHFYDFMDSGTPVVFFDKTSPEIKDCSKVIIDDYSGAYQAVESLIQQGCKRIAHLQGPGNAHTFQNRLRGYLTALKDYQLPVDPDLIIECPEFTLNRGRLSAHQLVALPKGVDGLFAVTDLLAIGAMKGFREKGIQVPEEVAIIGFSNWEMVEAVFPPLSSVSQPGYEMGRQATQILLKEIKASKNEEDITHETVTLATELVVRASSKSV